MIIDESIYSITSKITTTLQGMNTELGFYLESLG